MLNKSRIHYLYDILILQNNKIKYIKILLKKILKPASIIATLSMQFQHPVNLTNLTNAFTKYMLINVIHIKGGGFLKALRRTCVNGIWMVNNEIEYTMKDILPLLISVILFLVLNKPNQFHIMQ